jgi:hypothetical protein
VVQVDPIKPTLKAPESKLLKVKYGKALSNSGFKFNLRRYIMATDPAGVPLRTSTAPTLARYHLIACSGAPAFTFAPRSPDCSL